MIHQAFGSSDPLKIIRVNYILPFWCRGMETRVFEEEKAAFVGKRVFLDDFVLPDYDAFNIRNVKSLVGKVFGVDALKPALVPDNVVDDFDGVEKVFLVVIDGLGYNRLLAYVKEHDGFLSEIVGKGVLKPFTSPFPATTSTSLTSIFTGFTPAEHGVVGYQMFSREYGCVFNTLDMKPVYGYSSEVEIARDYSRRLKPWMPVLEERRVGMRVVTKGSIVGSGLSRVIHAGQETVPYSLESEMFVKCKKVLEQPDSVFLVLYYSGIDTQEHRFGPYSEEVTAEIESFEFLLKNFFRKLSDITKRETMIMLTADHGVCETKRTRYVKDFPEVADNLRLPPVGDSRTAFLFGKEARGERLTQVFERSFDGFKLVACDNLVDTGAFGRSVDSATLRSVIGDFAGLSKGPEALAYPYYEDERNREQHGGHGGMTPEEVIVPLLSIRLSKLGL